MKTLDYTLSEKNHPGIFNRERIYSIPGYAYFLYLLFPFRFWKPFVFSNQTEVVVVTVFFACVLLVFILAKAYSASVFQFTAIDLLLVVYGMYLLFRFRHPVEKEYLFLAFSIVCIYMYFRNFPEKYLVGLLFLLPVAGIIQMLDGINRFTMPWQNLSHITGIFQNSGLFGGFVALGLIVCAGLFLFSNAGKWYIKSVVLFILCIILAVQAYTSGSRASWLAALVAIFFLIYRFILPSLQGLRGVKQSKQLKMIGFLLASCLLTFLAISSNYLYHLKKDSADGRLLIAKVSVEMVKDAPVFGHGISGFRAEYLNYQANYFQTHPDSPYQIYADDVETPFNEFLKIFIEQGIVGLLLFLCLLYLLFEKGKPENTHYYLLQSVILFILIFGLFSYPFDKLSFVGLFVFSIAGLSKNRNAIFDIHLRKMNGFRISLLLAACFIL